MFSLTSLRRTLNRGLMRSTTSRCRPRRQRQPRLLLGLEQLEDRTLPSVTLFSDNPGFQYLRDITTDGITGFYSEGLGTSGEAIFRIGLSGGPAIPFAPGSDAEGITTDGTYLYWIDPNGDPDATAIFRVPIAGGPSEKTYSGFATGEPIVDGSGIEFVPGSGAPGILVTADEVQGRVHRLTATNPVSAITQLGPNRYGGFFNEEHANRITSDGSTVYVADSGHSSYGDTPPRVQSIPLDGASFTDLYVGTLPGFSPSGIAVAGGTIYLTSGNQVLSMPTSGGTPAVLVSDPQFVSLRSITVYNNALYVVDTHADSAKVWKIDQANPFAGFYAGGYNGSATHSGSTESVSGSVAAGVDNSGTITVTSPGAGQGHCDASGNVTLTAVGGFGNVQNVFYTFSGTIVISASGVANANGTWTATFDGGSGSGTWNATRGPATSNTVTTLTSSLNPAVLGRPVTFTATVSPLGSNSGTPTGTVTFVVDGVNQSPVSLDISGQAAYTTSSLSVGAHSIQASYNGGDGFNPSSSAMTETVNRFPVLHNIVGGDGQVFGLDEQQQLWRYRISDNSWLSAGYGGPEIAVSNVGDGNPDNDLVFVRGSDGKIWFWNVTSWTFTGGYLADITAGDNQVFGIGYDGQVWQFHVQNGWTASRGYGAEIIVGSVGDANPADDVVFLKSTDSRIWVWTQTAWSFTGGYLKTITAADNQVFGIGYDDQVWRFRVSGNDAGWRPSGGWGVALDVGNDGDGSGDNDLLFLRGADNRVWTWDQMSWQFTGGWLASFLAGDEQIFGTGLDGQAWRYRFSGPNAGWRASGLLGEQLTLANGMGESAAADLALIFLADGSVQIWDGGLPVNQPAQLTFKGTVAGAIANVPIPGFPSEIYTHNLSGTVTFVLQGDGSLSNPYQGTLMGQGQDYAVKTSGANPLFPPTASSPVEFVNVPVASSLHQITAGGGGTGFTFTFNGFVSATENDITGTLTITLTDFGRSVAMGVYAPRQ